MNCEKLLTNSIFEQPWWLDIVAQGQWNESVVEENKTVIARFPYVIKNGFISNPLYTQTLGIWMDNSLREIKRGNDQYSKQKEIINSLLAQLPPNRGINIVLDNSVQYILPFRWQGFEISPTFSYRIENVNQLDLIIKQFSKNVIRDCNRASRSLSVDENERDLEVLIELQNLTFSRQGRKNPISNNKTLKIMESAVNKGHGKLFIARDDSGKPHAASFLLFDERTSFHLLSGQNTGFGNDGAMPYLLGKEIEYSSKVSQNFDFEGSMVEGIEQTFRRYGGHLIINWQITRQSIIRDFRDILKPRIKRMLNYKI